MPSFLDYLDIPALQQAMANVPATQAAGNLAVQPKPVLSPLVQQAGARAEAGRTLALGERRLGIGAGNIDLLRRRVALEGRRANLESQQAAFTRRFEPFALGVGALGVGTEVLGGLRALEATRLQEARAGRLETLQEQTLRQQQEQTDILKRHRGALRLLYDNPTYYLQGP